MTEFNAKGFLQENSHRIRTRKFPERFIAYIEGNYRKDDLSSFLEREFDLSNEEANAVVDESISQYREENKNFIPPEEREEFIDPELLERIKKKETYPEFLWPYLYPELRDDRLKFIFQRIGSIYFDRGQPAAIDEVSNFLKRELTILTKDDEDQNILWYDRKIWNNKGEFLLKRIIEKNISNVSNHFIRECMGKIRRLTYLNNSAERMNNPRYLAFQNVVFDRKILKFVPFKKDYYLTFTLPSIYDTEFKDPKIKETCEKLVGKEKVRMVQEMFGFPLDIGYNIKEFLVLIGKTDTGKTTLLKILDIFLGGRVGGITIQQLSDEKFQTANLVDKLANICADIPTKKIIDSSSIKAITNEDKISVQRKGEQPFDAIIPAKLFFACNNFPYARDDSEAWLRRLVFVDFIYQFSEKERKEKTMKQAIEELTTPEELSGILNWAIEGLKNLRKRQSFLTEEEKKNRREIYEAKTRPIMFMIDSKYEFNELLWTFNKDLHKSYEEHCKKYNIESTSQGNLIKSLKWFYKDEFKEGKFYASTKSDPRNKGKITRCLIGIGLKGSETKEELIAEVEGLYE